MPADLTIAPAASDADIAAVRELFLEYENFLGFDLCFQGFEQELASLPGDYAPPRGCLLLARGPEAEVAGCAAVRPFEQDICEMKRLYLRSPYRGRGQGRRLAVLIVEAAREIGYAAMRLDTVGRLTESIALYRSLGFRDIPPYRVNPHEDVVYLELEL